VGKETSISWCDHTFNPWIGCAKVSAGCKNCYASVGTFTRFQRSKGLELWGENAARHVTSDANWRKPLSWAKAARAAGVRRRVFCASMADVFEDRRDLDDQRARLWNLIEETPDLDWLLLTKRPENHEMVPLAWQTGTRRPTNLWFGTTTEDQANADKRVPHLIAAKWPTVRFISYEPGLGPLDLGPWIMSENERAGRRHAAYWKFTRQANAKPPSMADPAAYLPGIDWVICGGESGPGARMFNMDWARAVRDQCAAAGVRFFFKQAGSRPIDGYPLRLRDRKGGDLAELGHWPREFPR
jgi:protein gp37